MQPAKSGIGKILVSGDKTTVLALLRDVDAGRDIVSAVNFHGSLCGEVTALSTVVMELLMHLERGTKPEGAQFTDRCKAVVLRSTKLLNAIEAAQS